MLARKCCARPVSKGALVASRFFTLKHEHRKPESISDAEWEARTGRAISVLTETLPQFFSTGLVLSIDKSKLPDIVDAPWSRMHHALNGTGVRDVVEGVGSLVTGKSRAESAEECEATELDVHGDIEPIYSSKIQLVYTPEGFGRTLHIQGTPLYITSSGFVRHTLNALYSDLRVDLLSVRTTPSPSSPSLNKFGKNRDRSLSMRIGVSGLARVSGAKSEWEVDCTYSFSPITGLVLIHAINSIHPAPHESVYEAFRLGFGRLSLGFDREPGADAHGTICKARTMERNG